MKNGQIIQNKTQGIDFTRQEEGIEMDVGSVSTPLEEHTFAQEHLFIDGKIPLDIFKFKES